MPLSWNDFLDLKRTEENICDLTKLCFIKLIELEGAPVAFRTPDFLNDIEVHLNPDTVVFLFLINSRSLTVNTFDNATFLVRMRHWHWRDTKLFKWDHYGTTYSVTFCMDITGWAAMMLKIHDLDGSFFSRLEADYV